MSSNTEGFSKETNDAKNSVDAGTSTTVITSAAASFSSRYPSTSRSSNQQNNDMATPFATGTSTSLVNQLLWVYQSNFPSSAVRPGAVGFPLQKRQKLSDVECHLPPPIKNLVSADIPQPPNWAEHMHDVSQSLNPYKLFPVDSATDEYQKLVQLLRPLHISSVEQIVNPKVWNRFVNGRKEMLKTKCNDPTVLRQLGLSDSEISKKKQSLNFFRHTALDASPYNDNFVLLFHCTRAQENIEYIQRDGFDERMSNGGSLGKGIYFSDNFKRSIVYDGSGGVLFICAVLLGDCVFAPHELTKTLMKEPEKLRIQRRFIDDNYFDSVSGILRSTTDTPHSTGQYAVYNRYQCYPMYKVHYHVKIDNDSTVISPPFVWTAEKMWNTFPGDSPWALHAKTIFDAMKGCGQIRPIYISIPIAEESLDEKMETLKSLGYTNASLNLRTLKENNFETKPTVNVLLQQNIDEAIKLQSEVEAKNKNESESESEGSSYHSTTDDEGSSYHTSTDEDNPKPSTSKTQRIRKKAVSALADKDCSICYNTYPRKSNSWRTLPQCQHQLCVDCYEKLKTTRTTMAGVEYTFLKCPFCLSTFGTEIGLCPDGQMTERLVSTHCDGYEDCDTIMITYTVNTPIDLSAHPDVPSHSRASTYKTERRIAYLPNNKEGQKILHLLRFAWNRRLIFTIDTSHTTGLENVLVWNIHHKTWPKGGVACHGYPDDTYLHRVRAELKSFGID